MQFADLSRLESSSDRSAQAFAALSGVSQTRTHPFAQDFALVLGEDSGQPSHSKAGGIQRLGQRL